MPPRLLFLAYHFPPVKVVSVLRLRHIYLGFRRRWGAVDVLTSANRRLFEQDPALAVDAQVEEIPAWDLRRLLAGRSRTGRSYRGADKKLGAIGSWASRLIDSFPFNVLLSFGGPLYLLLGYRRAVRIVQERNITYLFSSYRPLADHLIAYWLKGRFPHLCWIADFRDLPVDEHRGNTLFPDFQHWIQRRLLSRADRLTTVSEGLAGALRRYHPDVYVLRNGIDPELIAEETPLPEPGPFTIVYTGSLYPEQQSALPLLTALSRLIDRGVISPEDIRLVYAGKDGAVWRGWMQQAGLSLPVVDRGVLSRQEAVALQRRAHLNLLLSWSSRQSGGILTAKLYEYLAARRPILALIEGERDEEWEQLFRPIPECRLFYPQLQPQELLEEYLLAQFNRRQAGETPPPIGLSHLQPHTWPARMEIFLRG